MRVEKQGSNGNPGFLRLFDWNVKSRKKLQKTPYLPEQSKQKRSNDTDMPITQFHPVNEDYTAKSLSLEGSSVYSYAYSQMNEDEYCKPPGVVARLMGLDSLPTSNFSDTLLDSRPMRDSSAIYVRKSPKLEHKDCSQIEQKHKVIEKFQTESLPPKSARSVPITQHKLLSPINSSRFVSPNDPARITEAASRIPSSVPSSARKQSKIYGIGRRVGESNAARNLKGQSMNKSWDGCLESKPLKVLEDGKKSVSLALQAKVNIQKREGLSSRSLYAAESINSQPNRQKSTLKKPSTNSVLKQNNQKQNCVQKSAAKSSVSSIRSQSRKQVLEKSSSKTSRNSTNKTIDRRKDFMEDVKNGVRVKKDRSGNVVRSNGSDGSDVVSFTFTSPISRSTDKKNAFNGNGNGLNSANGGDSLSILLEQKLRYLTAMSSPSGSQESSTSYRARINRIPIFEGKRNQNRISKDDLCSGLFSIDRYPSLISLTRPSFLAESCISSDSANSYGTKVFSKKSTMMELDDAEPCNESEPRYVKDILSDIESMFEDFSLGRTRKIVNPRRFDELEAQSLVLEKQNEPKLRSKLVFDCVSECVDSKCRVWARGLAAVRRKDWLAEEVCNKISGWEQMKDCMVEELVDEDMSGDQRQKWLDYDVEMFEIGVEIGRRLLESLINEVVADILVP